VLFDLAPEIANERRSAARDPDRFESESTAFFDRTRAEYLRRAEEAPYRFAIIDSSQSIARIQKQLEELLASL
jgi:dTMP kinase